MSSKLQAVRIGIFTAVAGALAAVVIAVWGGLHLFKHRLGYAIELESSVYGLSRGAEVFFNGIPVGSVRSIDIARGDLRHVRVEIVVDDDTPVRADTKATLALSGLTGSKVIDLHPGSPDTAPLPEHSVIAVGETTIDKLERQLEDLTDRSRRLLERADRIEASAETAMANLADLTDPKRYAGVIVELRDSIAELGRTTASARAVIEDNRGPLRAAVGDLRQASRSFKELLP